MATLKQSTAYTRAFLLVQTADHVSGLTGATPTVTLSKAGAAFGAAGGTITEIASGWYKIALTTTDTNTLGDLAFHITATSGDPTDFVDQVTANILGDTLPANLTQVNAHTVTDTTSGVPDVNVKNFGTTAVTGRDIGASVLLSPGTGTGQLSITTGAVTVGTNNDKTGYTASTVSDKTGYSLTQTFPTNFSSLAITAGGYVTVGTNNDKTGYTASTVSDKTGYSLTVTPPTAATIATTVWQDTTAGDFTVASSIGKSLFTSGNAPGAASGLALVGSNMGTVSSVTGAVGSVTGAVGSVTGSVGSVTGAVGSVTAAVSVTGDLTSTMKTSVENAVWNATMSGHTTAGSAGAELTSASTAGDPWAVTIPGSYAAGTAGHRLGNVPDTTFPPNFSSLGITAGGHISVVDTLTTYTGNTPQTGDAYVRIGSAGAGLTALGDTRIANLASGGAGLTALGDARIANLDAAMSSVPASVWAYVVEGSYSALSAIRLMLSALTGLASGLSTTTASFRDVANTKNRIVATVDTYGNRSAITLDAS